MGEFYHNGSAYCGRVNSYHSQTGSLREILFRFGLGPIWDPRWYLLRSGKPPWLRLLLAWVTDGLKRVTIRGLGQMQVTRGFFLSIGSGR